MRRPRVFAVTGQALAYLGYVQAGDRVNIGISPKEYRLLHLDLPRDVYTVQVLPWRTRLTILRWYGVRGLARGWWSV